MRFINIAELQLKAGISQELILKSNQDFFEEYFSVFEDRQRFQNDIDNVLFQADKRQTITNTEKLEKRLTRLAPSITSIVDDIISPDIIFFLGLGSWDGHGIILDGRPYTFFDMTRMNAWMAHTSFMLEPHLIHEVFHSIHYYYSPEFYPGNYQSVRDSYVNKMIAEGVATYLASCATKTSLDDALWLGLLDESSVKKWIKKCEESKKHTWRAIEEAVSNNHEDEPLGNRLFSVPGITSDLLTEGRSGYYYGVKIAERTVKNTGNAQLLSLKSTIFQECLESYFEED